MSEAIVEQNKCTTDTKVGAVAVHNGRVVATSHKTGNKVEFHAEQILLDKLKKHCIKLEECTIYVTMEPCAGGGNSCAEKLSKAKLKEVVIGCYDLNSEHYRKGWTILNNRKICLRDFDADLREKINEINAYTNENYRRKTGPHNHGKFPYDANGNNRELELQFSDTDLRKITLRAASNSPSAVSILCLNGATALATGASEIQEIDDPTALDLNERAWVVVQKNEIAILCSDDGCVAMKIKDVKMENKSFNYEFKVFPNISISH